MKIIRIAFIMTIIFIGITTSSYAKFITKIEGKGRTQIKNPILVFQNENIKEGIIDSQSNIYETCFSIANYYNSKEVINEIPFKYKIKLEASTRDFPVKYKLISLKTNKEILLNENLETNEFDIGTEKQIDEYKLIVEWINNAEMKEYTENLEVKIRILANQVR